jgi:hypothetical protein
MADRKGGPRKLWCAYNDVTYVLFGTELTGYRYATEHNMRCRPVVFGKPIYDQTVLLDKQATDGLLNPENLPSLKTDEYKEVSGK